MITIKLNPQKQDDYTPLTASVQGTVLTVNGESFDLSLLEDGDTAEHEVLQYVERQGDDYTVQLFFPISYSTFFTDDIVVMGDGPVALPSHGGE